MGNISILNGHTIKDAVARKSHDDFVDQVNEAFETINTEFASVDEKLENQRLTLNGLGSALQQTNSNVNTLSGDLKTLDGEVDNLLLQINGLGASITSGATKAGDSKKLDGKDPSYYLDYNNLTNKPANTGGGGGGGTAITNVNTLPNNPDETVLYRVPVDSGEKYTLFSASYGEISSGDFLYGIQIIFQAVNDEEEMEAYREEWKRRLNTTEFVLQKDSNEVHYLSPDSPDSLYQISLVLEWKLGMSYGGVVASKEQAVNAESWYFLVEKNAPTYAIYQYKNGWVRVDGGIIDVDDFPTENIRSDVFYRTKEKSDVYATLNGLIDDISGILVKWYVVPELPQIGKPANLGNFATLYFCEADKMVYGYTQGMWVTYTALLAGLSGVPEAYIMPMIGGIYRKDELPDELDPSKIYVVYTPKTNHEMKYFYGNAWYNAKPALSVKEANSFAELGLILAEGKDTIEVIIEAGTFKAYANDGHGGESFAGAVKFTVCQDEDNYYVLKANFIDGILFLVLEYKFDTQGVFWSEILYGIELHFDGSVRSFSRDDKYENTCLEDIKKITIISKG